MELLLDYRIASPTPVAGYQLMPQRVLTSRLDSNLWGAGHAQNEKAFNFVYNLAGLETTSRGAVRI